MTDHPAHSLPTPRTDTHSTLISLFLTNLRCSFCLPARCRHLRYIPWQKMQQQQHRNVSATQTALHKADFQNWKLCTEGIHQEPNRRAQQYYPAIKVKRTHCICTVCTNEGKKCSRFNFQIDKRLLPTTQERMCSDENRIRHAFFHQKSINLCLPQTSSHVTSCITLNAFKTAT